MLMEVTTVKSKHILEITNATRQAAGVFQQRRITPVIRTLLWTSQADVAKRATQAVSFRSRLIFSSTILRLHSGALARLIFPARFFPPTIPSNGLEIYF